MQVLNVKESQGLVIRVFYLLFAYLWFYWLHEGMPCLDNWPQNIVDFPL